MEKINLNQLFSRNESENVFIDVENLLKKEKEFLISEEYEEKLIENEIKDFAADLLIEVQELALEKGYRIHLVKDINCGRDISKEIYYRLLRKRIKREMIHYGISNKITNSLKSINLF